ncbi:MAG: hypothetical protein ABIG93_05485 [archaeon]
MNIQRVKYKDIEEVPHIRIKKDFKEEFFGSSPAPFIGRFGYPNVNIGVLSPQFHGDTSYYDSPKLWSKANFKIGQIASLRYGLVNSRTKWNIKDVHNTCINRNIISPKLTKFVDICQEVGMAKTAAELEIQLNKKPSLNFRHDREIIPFGPRAEIKKARITANTKVDTRIDKVVSDTDLKAAPAIIQLYKKGFEETSLNKLISVGNLGIKKNRKLVPTRWSITAVDDVISKQLIKEVKDQPIGDYQLYFGGGWGNYYLVFFFPEVWSYELFETYLDKKVNPWSKNSYAYSTDYESYKGRTTYAEECAGGFYSSRLGCVEKLKNIKRQCSVLALRFITQEYNVPLGVFVCREATRKAVNNKPIIFSTKELMIKYAKTLIKNKFNFDLEFLLGRSKLLRNIKSQKKILEFI